MLPTIHPFGIEVSMYWLCGVVALLIAGTAVVVRRRTFGVAAQDLLQILAQVVIGAVVGAKLFHIIGGILLHGQEAWFWTAENWTNQLKAGGVFYGGLIGAAALALLHAKWRQMNLRNVLDLMAIFPPAFGMIARFGCLFAGCCYGIEAQHMITVPGTVYAVPRIPSPLLESALNLAIFLYLLIAKPEHKRPGTCFPLYLLLYSAGRFVLEFFRGDENRGVFLLSTSQWIAIVLIAVASAYLWCQKRRSESRKLLEKKKSQ